MAARIGVILWSMFIILASVDLTDDTEGRVGLRCGRPEQTNAPRDGAARESLPLVGGGGRA